VEKGRRSEFQLADDLPILVPANPIDDLHTAKRNRKHGALQNCVETPVREHRFHAPDNVHISKAGFKIRRAKRQPLDDPHTFRPGDTERSHKVRNVAPFKTVCVFQSGPGRCGQESRICLLLICMNSSGALSRSLYWPLAFCGVQRNSNPNPISKAENNTRLQPYRGFSFW
jgi:hypothetical protein